MKKMLLFATVVLFASGMAIAQDAEIAPDPPDPPDAPQMADPGTAPGLMGGPRLFVQRREMGMRTGGMMGGPGMGMMGPGPGKWWKNPDLAQKLALTDDQISKMDKIFQDHRLKLIDLHATLEKQEVLLEPMIDADHPDEDRVLSQIDQVAQARAELEKANARMLLGIRNVLTPDQWKKLQTERATRRAARRDDRPIRQRLRIHQPPAAAPGAPAPPDAPSNPNPQ
jgi:Spy/CpxP family protein refolding chaperone